MIESCCEVLPSESGSYSRTSTGIEPYLSRPTYSGRALDWEMYELHRTGYLLGNVSLTVAAAKDKPAVNSNCSIELETLGRQ